ncbi:MAG: yqfD, partial [Clostridia bacterium]|nr:yqfD [Clostridia bacterium]
MIKVINFVNYLFGYAEFEIHGPFGEDFINLAVQNTIELWGIRRKSSEVLTAKVHLYDYKKLPPLAEKSKETLVLTVKEGIPRKVYKYRFRYGLLTGFILFFASLFLMSSFMWSIEVVGVNDINSISVIERLAEYGFKVGSFNGGHDLQKLKLLLMRDFDKMAFVTINIKGSRAEVEVTERIMPPPIVPSHIPCNIIAARDGQIVTMETYNGVTTFKAGDAVKKGQLLVSGVLDSTRVGYRMVHAEAKVEARTLRNIKVSKEYKKIIPVETGRSLTVYSLKIFNYSINLSLNSRNLFEKCDIIKESTDLKLGKDIILPVALIKTVYKEINELEYFMSEQELIDDLKAEINELTRIKLQGLNIEDEKLNFKESITGIEADYVCTVIEDITEKREIYRNND